MKYSIIIQHDRDILKNTIINSKTKGDAIKIGTILLKRTRKKCKREHYVFKYSPWLFVEPIIN